jgi:AMMECR1 domain-containing protein
MTPRDLKLLCIFCLQILIKNLKNDNSSTNFPTSIKGEYPIFVTWQTGKRKSLRGCIGTFEKMPLNEQLPKIALDSASNDSRFQPITLD